MLDPSARATRWLTRRTNRVVHLSMAWPAAMRESRGQFESLMTHLSLAAASLGWRVALPPIPAGVGWAGRLKSSDWHAIDAGCGEHARRYWLPVTFADPRVCSGTLHTALRDHKSRWIVSSPPRSELARREQSATPLRLAPGPTDAWALQIRSLLKQQATARASDSADLWVRVEGADLLPTTRHRWREPGIWKCAACQSVCPIGQAWPASGFTGRRGMDAGAG